MLRPATERVFRDMRKTVLLFASMAVALVVAEGAALAATPIGTTAGVDAGALRGAKGREAGRGPAGAAALRVDKR